jgi:methyl-accepting chemotaxis protein
MAEVAEKTGDLRDAIETIDGDLGFTLDSLAEFSETARRAEQSALTLADDTHTIEALLKLIRSIADQAKILSLNALVEAASAGEAGLGFRVVANEMKDLAERTEQATAQIGSQVTNIRQTSDASRTAHATMRQQFDGLKTTTDRMRQTLNAQARSVKEITRCVEDTAMGAKASSRAIGQMEAGIEDLSGAIGAVSAEVTALDTSLLSLRTTADAFTAKLRA